MLKAPPKRRSPTMPQHDPRTDARTEPTTVYEATTRTRALAPKLARMVELSEGPVYVFITCGQHTPHARERADWENAIRALVRNGTRLIHFITPDTGEEEADLARALTDESPQCDWIPIVRSEVEKLGLARFHYVVAWEGAVEAPRQALLWIERAREGDELEIGAELYDSATLRSDGRLLLARLRQLGMSFGDFRGFLTL